MAKSKSILTCTTYLIPIPKSAHLVPVAQFDYQLFEPADRLPAFRDVLSDVYDIDAIGNRDEFKVLATGYMVDNILFNTVSFTPSTFHRNTSHLQGDEQNFLVPKSCKNYT